MENNVYLCGMIEELPYYEDWADVYNEPLFEYVNEVSNKFWPDAEPYWDSETGKEEIDFSLSRVPCQFAKRYKDGKIDISRLPLYLNASSNGKSIKQHHGLDDDIKEQDLTLIEKNRIYATLRAYGLDVSKFWYLCICIKDYVVDLTINAVASNKNSREKLTELTNKLDELQPEIELARIKTTGKAKLTLNVNRKNVVIEDGHTLTLLNMAITDFLKNCPPTNNFLDVSIVDFENKKDLSPIYRLSLFNKYLGWFLSQRKADDDFVKNSQYVVSTDKSLLVSRMVYLMGLSNDERYMQEFNEKTGNRLNWLKSSLKGYEDVKITTHGSIYW